MEPKFEQPKQKTPEEIAALEKSRTISDAELLKDGDYIIGEDGEKKGVSLDEKKEAVLHIDFENEDKEKDEVARNKELIEKLRIDKNLGNQKFLEEVRVFFASIGVEAGSEQESQIVKQFSPRRYKYQVKGGYSTDEYICSFQGNPIDLLTHENNYDDSLLSSVDMYHRASGSFASDHRPGGGANYIRVELVPIFRDLFKRDLSNAINSEMIKMLTPWRGGSAVQTSTYERVAIILNDNIFSVDSAEGTRANMDVIEKSENKITAKTREISGGMVSVAEITTLHTITLDDDGKTVIKSERVPKPTFQGDTGP